MPAAAKAADAAVDPALDIAKYDQLNRAVNIGPQDHYHVVMHSL